MKAGQEPSVPYELRPPKWITKATRDGDLGYHAFYPPRPGQDEDVLSESTIRYGYTEPQFVVGELWHGTDTFGGIFKQENKDGLDSLQDIMERVLAKRAELHATVEENVFKLPARVTLAGDKRIQWYADLANPDVPLQKLAKTVPHGKKDQELLELLFSNKTPVDRAVWYIRCLGAIEIQARNKSNAQPVTSTEWTNIVTSHIKKQLVDIAMPTTLRTGTNIKQSFKKSKLNDPEWKDTWVARFAYSLDLLHLLFDSDLLDQPTLLTWLIATSSISEGVAPHQFVFLVRLAHEYFDILVSNRAFATPMIESCAARYAEESATAVASSPSRQYATYILDSISSLILRLFTESPDLFMNRAILSSHSTTLHDALLQAIQQLDSDLQPRIREDVMTKYSSLIERGEAIMAINIPQDDEAMEVETRLRDIALLNSIDICTDLVAFSFLPTPALSPTGSFDLRPFSRRLPLLLSWSTNPNQAGSREARPYCASVFIALWKAQAISVLPNSNQILQRHLLGWLEEKGFLRPRAYANSLEKDESTLEKDEVEATAVLFGNLIQRKLFSFPDYLTRMTSFGQGSASTPRAETTSPNRGDSPSLSTVSIPDHLELLRCLPLWDKVSEQLLSQRKIVLYGIRARKTVEDAMEKDIRAELRRVVPTFFNGLAPQEAFGQELLPKTLAATKFVQARVLYHWLFDLVKDYVSRVSSSSSHQPVLPVSVYGVLIQLFSWTSCFPAIMELNALLLSYTMDDELLLAVLNSIRQFLNIWVNMMQVDQIAENLLEANLRLREQTRKSPKHLIMLLSELDRSCALMPSTIERIHLEVAEARKLLVSDSHSSPAMPILPLIQAAILEDSLEQPDNLATTLWYKNRMHGDWGTVSWQAIISSIELHSWNVFLSDAEMARRFAALGWNIDNHLPDGIEDVVRTWFETGGAEKMVHASDDVWEMVKELCLRLVLNGVIAPSVVLKGLVYSAWRPTKQSSDNDELLQQSLRRTLTLMNTMVLCIPPPSIDHGDSIESRLQLETCRARCVHPSNLLGIIDGLSVLSVLETDPTLDPTSRQLLEQFRTDLVGDAFVKEEVLSRTALLERAFEAAARKYPAEDATLIANLRGCVALDCTKNLNATSTIDISQWTFILNTADIWTFERLALDIRLLFRQLFTHNSALSEEQRSIDATLTTLACAVLDQPLSSSSITLMAILLADINPAIAQYVVTRGLNQLTLFFGSSPRAVPDDDLSFLAPSKATFRLVITFYRSIFNNEAINWPLTERNEFLRCWASQMAFFKQLLETKQTRITHEAADAICFMLRVLHFFVEFVNSDWGSDLAADGVNLASLLINLAIMFGGVMVIDDITFSLLVDTTCILIDGCSKETRQLITKSLADQFPISALPDELPNSSRQRLTSILPFNPKDKFGSSLARAQRSADGTLSYISKARSRPWEWMDSIEPRETPPLLSTKVKNASAMPLELFETRSKGENIIPGPRVVEASAQMEDIWSFRDHIVSEGLVGRSWREGKSAWDARSLDGSERVGSSIRGLSPAASRSSAHMSTSSRKASPSLNISGRLHPISMSTVETVVAEPVAETRNQRGLKRKERVEDLDDDDVVMLDQRVGSKTTQTKRGRGKGKSKR